MIYETINIEILIDLIIGEDGQWWRSLLLLTNDY